MFEHINIRISMTGSQTIRIFSRPRQINGKVNIRNWRAVSTWMDAHKRHYFTRRVHVFVLGNMRTCHQKHQATINTTTEVSKNLPIHKLFWSMLFLVQLFSTCSFVSSDVLFLCTFQRMKKKMDFFNFSIT